MKRSFTLMEMMIAIVLFSIVLVFLYQALDTTKKSNDFYGDKLEYYRSKSDIQKLLFVDILNKDGNITISQDKNRNNIIQFKTSNIYHNPFFTNVTYLVSKENNLLRCESKIKFDKNNIYKFVQNSYIDIVDHNITKFKIAKNKTDKTKHILYIQYNDNDFKLSINSF